MTGKEADLLAARLSIHLRQNNFAVCREIIDHAEHESKKTEREDPWDTAIAETDLDLRWVNALESAGYLYLIDLRDLDLQQACIPNIGNCAKRKIKELLERLAESLCYG